METQLWASNVLNPLTDAFSLLTQKIVVGIPVFILALIVFLIGLILGSAIGKFFENLIDLLKIDVLLEKVGLGSFFERANLRLDSGRFIGELIKWFIVLVFFLAAADILGLFAVSSFIANNVLPFIPQAVIAVLILLAAVLFGNFMSDVVRSSVSGAGLPSANALATLTAWSIYIFALLIALDYLGVAMTVINIILTGFIAMVAIAGGLAFGLGGKDFAESLLEKLKRQLEGK